MRWPVGHHRARLFGFIDLMSLGGAGNSSVRAHPGDFLTGAVAPLKKHRVTVLAP